MNNAEQLRSNVISIFEDNNLDAVVYPSGTILPPKIENVNPFDNGQNANLASTIGFASMSVPAGFAAGLPVGIDFMGMPFSEPDLIGLSYAFEQANLDNIRGMFPTSTPSLPGEVLIHGDFDANGLLDVADLDALTDAVSTGTDDARFDLDRNGMVDPNDREVWITDIKNTFFGDANLDGQVNAEDLNTLALNWRSMDAISWSQGDFNGDRNVNSSDLNDLALSWRSGIAENAFSVPEPSSMALLLGGIMWLNMSLTVAAAEPDLFSSVP